MEVPIGVVRRPENVEVGEIPVWEFDPPHFRCKIIIRDWIISFKLIIRT